MCSDPKKNFNKEEVTETGVGQLEALKAMISFDSIAERIKDYFEQKVFGDGDSQCLIDALRVCAEDDDTNIFRDIDWRSDAVDAIFEVLFEGPYKDAIVVRAKEEWPGEEGIEGFGGFLDVVCCRSYLYEAFGLAADGVEAATAEGISDPKPVDEPTETK